jgi:hypothetical protein
MEVGQGQNCGCSAKREKNDGIVPQIRPRPLPSKSFAIIFVLILPFVTV